MGNEDFQREMKRNILGWMAKPKFKSQGSQRCFRIADRGSLSMVG